MTMTTSHQTVAEMKGLPWFPSIFGRDGSRRSAASDADTLLMPALACLGLSKRAG